MNDIAITHNGLTHFAGVEHYSDDGSRWIEISRRDEDGCPTEQISEEITDKAVAPTDAWVFAAACRLLGIDIDDDALEYDNYRGAWGA